MERSPDLDFDSMKFDPDIAPIRNRDAVIQDLKAELRIKTETIDRLQFDIDVDDMLVGAGREAQGIVEADEALAIGLATRVVDADRLEAEVAEIAEALAAGAPLAQRFIKVALDRSASLTFEQALAFEEQAQATLLGSEDLFEGAAAFIQKRPPEFRGR